MQDLNWGSELPTSFKRQRFCRVFYKIIKVPRRDQLGDIFNRYFSKIFLIRSYEPILLITSFQFRPSLNSNSCVPLFNFKVFFRLVQAQPLLCSYFYPSSLPLEHRALTTSLSPSWSLAALFASSQVMSNMVFLSSLSPVGSSPINLHFLLWRMVSVNGPCPVLHHSSWL